MADVTLGEWLPDRSYVDTPNLSDIANVYPISTGYKSFSGPSTIPGISELKDASDSAAPCRGAMSGQTQSGVEFTVAAAKDDNSSNKPAVRVLWGASDWIDITPSGGEFDAFENRGKFSFALYGDRIIAVAPGCTPCSIDTATSEPDGVNKMAALGTGASRAALAEIHKEFLIFGDIIGQAPNTAIGTARAGVHWSAIGNPTSWPTVGTQAAIDVQSDYQLLDGDTGPITDIVSAGEYCAVFRERSLVRMDYVGSPGLFSFRTIDSNRGCVIPQCAVALGGIVYFPSAEGFMMFNGAAILPIGEERIDRTWRELMNFENTRHVVGSYNAETESIYWTVSDSDDAPTTIFAYRPALDKWFKLEDQSAYWLMDSSAEVVAGSLESEPYSFYQLEGIPASPPDWQATHTYTQGDIVKSTTVGFTNYSYRNLTGGDSGSTSPTGTDLVIADGSTFWRFQSYTDNSTLQNANLDELGVRDGKRVFSTIDGSSRLQIYNQDTNPIEGKIITGDYEMPNEDRGMLRWIRTISRGNGTISGAASGRLNPGDAIEYRPLTSKPDMNILSAGGGSVNTIPFWLANGQFGVSVTNIKRVGGRYMRVAFSTSGQIDSFSGFDFELAGMRKGKPKR